MAWCPEHGCPDECCERATHAADRVAEVAAHNFTAAELWMKRAIDMRRILERRTGEEFEWIDIRERKISKPTGA